jgi:hypothetical protein
MNIKLTTWHSMLARYGDYEAHRRLRWLQREWAFIKEKRDPFSLIFDLVHVWPGRAPPRTARSLRFPSVDCYVKSEGAGNTLMPCAHRACPSKGCRKATSDPARSLTRRGFLSPAVLATPF